MFQEEKLINDPIHGYMTFEKWAVEFIDTNEFQRLRDIKQLGASYYVFPGACHNRFEHRTAHLAYTLTKKLYEQKGISKKDKDLECVTLAALCHDLGHGPFSHVFDNEVIPQLGKVLNHEIKWKHENGSEMMLDHLYESLEPPSIDLTTDDLKFIKALIRGDRTDALVKANSKYHFEDIIYDSEEYIKLNDSILYEIEYSDPKCKELEDSRNIVKRIRQRKLYKFVNECLIPKDKEKDITKENLNEREIASCGKDLKEEDIIVDWQDFNYAKGENNPVEDVKFYKKNLEVIKLKPDEISYLFPKQYEEKIVRIYARYPEKIALIHEAFQILAKRRNLTINKGFLPGEKVDFLDVNCALENFGDNQINADSVENFGDNQIKSNVVQ
ncbi:35286_t:CDS:2 [Gigaspora margarita]|uniref:35286_t:CDS:1 n=1 Tax=Gigaspora margarita TaxID=4874 RepID=A0ABM8VYD4_GIGMA|nr:35286_t:CDS:2 [Gigaspora margarita]